MEKCHCGSDKAFEACCGPIIAGDTPAPTAESLMRARYSAYVVENIDFIKQSTHKSAISSFDEEGTRRWSRDSVWMGLEIRSVRNGSEADREGEVEFVASYIQDEEEFFHHERASFKKEGQKWFFVDGEPLGGVTYVRETPKVGRNEPCPCGSGKKYKKCCMKK